MNNGMIAEIRAKGVVGAGGAGFPTYAKLKPPIEILIVNGAECEPLLHKDKELLKHYGKIVLEGAARLRDIVQAREAVLGIKEKYRDIIAELTPLLPDCVRIQPLGDFYPAGDEFVLVYDVTGKVIPRGGLPLHVGAVVINVETVLNVMQDRPVIHKYFSVGGAVCEPQTLRAPIGMSFREAIEACGGPACEPFAVLAGGVMMGRLVRDMEEPITKTTGGLLLFPQDHPLIAKYSRDDSAIKRIGKSACDQCTFCTELCPRYLLGHPIEPHKAMRALGFSHEKLSLVIGTQFCCECNLCTMIACPEDLDPKNVCVMNKRELREQKMTYPADAPSRPAHPLLEGRRTPISRLFKKLGLTQFANRGPLSEKEFAPDKVVILLKQHVGTPAKPTVSPGARVQAGDVIANVAEKDLGVPIHASINGVVGNVSDVSIEIGRG
ncbi:MAG: 4Fe-4S dicluster domain-containing protein [Candidatus Omnitrophota bacterium]